MYEKETELVRSEIRKRIEGRVREHKEAFNKLGLDRFYICGGALQPEEPNDYDLFPVRVNDFNPFFTWKRGERPSINDARIWETPNAVTYEIDGIKIQLCKYHFTTLKDTIERFDFTHCKIGVEVHKYITSDKTKTLQFIISDVYVSPDFIRYRMLGYSEYTGAQLCDYPLSSLLRMWKYMQRGYIRSSYDVIFKILEAMLERGWKNQEDFRKQLEGIDIGLDEANKLTENAECLRHIYYLVTGDAITDMSIFDRNLLIGDSGNRRCIT